MASEKVRTGLELEVFTMGQVAKKLDGIEPPMRFRILNHLISEAAQESQADRVENPRPENLFDE